MQKLRNPLKYKQFNFRVIKLTVSQEANPTLKSPSRLIPSSESSPGRESVAQRLSKYKFSSLDMLWVGSGPKQTKRSRHRGLNGINATEIALMSIKESFNRQMREKVQIIAELLET